MSVNNAISSAVSALLAQSYALENISSNIANSQTTAYKRTDTSFSNLVDDPGANPTSTGGVTASGTATTGVSGGYVSSSISSYMAISGDGYFVVAASDGDGGFSNGDYYTRRGDFTLDKDGHFVNGAGYYLEGVSIDPATGSASGSDPSVLTIDKSPLAPKATTEITYKANLPSDPKTTASEAGGSDLYSGTALGNVTADDSATFEDESISGGTVTVYDAQGKSYDVELRWAKVADGDPNADPPTEDTWNLYYHSNSSATGTDTEWVNAGASYTFNSSGKMTSSTSSVTLSDLTIDGTNLGDLTIDHGTGGMTEYADSVGSVYVNTASQDGYASGDFEYATVSDSGVVSVTYSNGVTVDVAQVVTATFNSSNQLEAMGSGIYSATADSGDALIDTTGKGILSGMLEGSNTDITEEFSKLIITQQAYSAATRIMTTADEMMQEAVNMIR